MASAQLSELAGTLELRAPTITPQDYRDLLDRLDASFRAGAPRGGAGGRDRIGAMTAWAARVTPQQFRKLALSLPEAGESSTWAPRTSASGTIFATLGNPDKAWGVVALTPDQQALLAETSPDVFTRCPAPGECAAGRVRLAAADAALKNALTLAWQSRAPKALLKRTEAPMVARVLPDDIRVASTASSRGCARPPRRRSFRDQEGSWYGHRRCSCAASR